MKKNRNRTQKCIIDALADLMKDKTFDSVTVKDIAAQAGINRTTFYRHFSDKFAIAKAIVDDVIEITIENIGDPETIYQKFSHPDPDEADFAEAFTRNSIESVCRVFDFFAANTRLFRPLLGSSGNMWFSIKLRDSLAEKYLALFEKIKDTKNAVSDAYTVSPRTAAVSRASMLVGLVSWWLDHGMPVPAKAMAADYCFLVAKGYYRAQGFFRS